MAQFGFENDIHSILKLDMPITNAPMARWQRKVSSSNTLALNGLSPGKSANVSQSSSKTPSKTPGKCVGHAALGLKTLCSQSTNRQGCISSFVSQAKIRNRHPLGLEVTASSQSETANKWMWQASCSQRRTSPWT